MSVTNGEEIKQALLRGEMTSQEAFELVTRVGAKPWKTKEWKKQRAERLGSACGQCGSATPPLVLQHTWHPKDLKMLMDQARSKYAFEYEKAHPKSSTSDYQQWYKAMREATDEDVRRDAVLQSIEDHERYMTCEDTITLCKKCAFLWDKKNVRMCPGCKRYYNHSLLNRCSNCL